MKTVRIPLPIAYRVKIGAALLANKTSPVHAQTLVAHWKLDETTNPSVGQTATDSSTRVPSTGPS